MRFLSSDFLNKPRGWMFGISILGIGAVENNFQKLGLKIHTNLQPNSSTVFYIYYAKHLCVLTVHPGHLQGVTNLLDMYSIYGNLS